MGRYSLEWVVFLAGACVMILELTGSRLLAPYLGTSIYVWTSLIGVILACLSLGYWLGGRLADRHPRSAVLAVVLLGAGLWMGLLSAASDRAVFATVSRIGDLRLGSTAVSMVLFGVPSVLLAMVSPYAARLKMSTVDRSGSTVGGLYALSTLGSILGTFLAGFVLVAYLSNTAILRILFLTLVFTSFLAHPRILWPWRGAAALLLGALSLFSPSFATPGYLRHVVDVNTPYTRAWIYDIDVPTEGGQAAARVLRLGIENSGAMFLQYWGSVVDYLQYFDLCEHFRPGLRRTLMIGGGSYTYPGLFLEYHPEARMDVVEIDPKVTDIARTYFFLEENPRLRIFHEDGRFFLNRTRERYDVIFLDAFKSLYFVPHHLTTREAVQAMDRALNPDGVVLVNLIGALEGPQAELVQSIEATFRSVFPHVLLFAVSDTVHADRIQNISLIALRSAAPPTLTSGDPHIQGLLATRWAGAGPPSPRILRDDFAPVEHLAEKAQPRRWEDAAGGFWRLKGIRKPSPVDRPDPSPPQGR